MKKWISYWTEEMSDENKCQTVNVEFGNVTV